MEASLTWLGKLTANVAKCRWSLGLMVKLPAVGFMQAMYWQLWMSFKINLLRSYLGLFTRNVTSCFPNSFSLNFSFFKQSEFSPIYEGPELLHSTQIQDMDMLRINPALQAHQYSNENSKTPKKKGKLKFLLGCVSCVHGVCVWIYI